MAIILLTTTTMILTAAADLVVKLDDVARVKHHRRGASGDMVPGEEHMRKLLLQWDSVEGALEYQVCHNCVFVPPEEKGHYFGEIKQGNIDTVPATQLKANRPVFIFPNAPLGKNTFRVRVSVKEHEWGPWSDPRNFMVDEPGTVQHQHEDEL